MSDSVRAHMIWGIPINFVVDDPDVLVAPLEEFAGAVVSGGSEGPAHTFSICEGDVDISGRFERRPRHRGGSSGNKRFMDGSVFNSELQNRFARVCHERTGYGIYDLDGCLITSTVSHTTVLGDARGSAAIADLIEAFIMEYARKTGWLQCHGAGWVIDGKCHLALGASGAGKTTRLLSSISDKGIFIGNDRVFLRFNSGVLEARGYPLPMNIGCGTIRALGLDVPHFDGADKEKIRLTSRDVQNLMTTDYSTWWKVESIVAPDEESIVENLYVEPDPCHPKWNIAWQTSFDPTIGKDILNSALAVAEFQQLYNNLGRVVRSRRGS
jgi:hypothetical protein